MYDYHDRAVKRSDIAAHAAGLRRPGILLCQPTDHDTEFLDLLDHANDQAKITDDEYHDIVTAHVIATALDRDTREPVYLTINVSEYAQTDDVRRAVRSARLLPQATGTRAAAAVICDRISDEAQQLAQQENAAIGRVKQKSYRQSPPEDTPDLPM